MNDNKDWIDELLKFSIPVYIVLITIWAATAHTITRIRKGELDSFAFEEWIGDIIVSSFVGAISYYLGKYYKLDDMLLVVTVAISAHLGTKVIPVFEENLTKLYETFFKR